MNIKALITTLAIVGSSSVAMARPVTYSAQAEASFSWGNDHRPMYNDRTVVVRDHRYTTTRPVRGDYYNDGWNYQPRFRPLGEELQFGDNEYRKDVAVGMGAGRFNTLRVDNEGGRSYIMKIGVEFSNGEVQMINVGRTLVGQQSMTFDLNGNGRQISRIFVYRDDGEQAYHINRQHRGAFTVSAL